ncbi:MAG: TetR/AcrR family transcriptional regulator [Acidobacteria bacterium]|nr:TetR/AcrR family transcriptional regulator [Acidobacteriota bacterium]
MGVAERRAREKDDLKKKILNAAAELFVEEGFENVSMRKIADRIEYAPSTIYLHFRDKVDLVGSLCTTTFAELDQRLQEIQDLGLAPLETLRKSLRAYIDFGLEHPSHYAFVFCTPSSVFKAMAPEGQEQLWGCGMGSFERLRVGMGLCMDTGAIRRADVETVSQATWLMMHGITTGLIFEADFPFIDRETLIEHSLDRMLDSLR